ncbi:cupin domain-containing protein, partial [Pseudomonas syringae pv. tagetis]
MANNWQHFHALPHLNRTEMSMEKFAIHRICRFDSLVHEYGLEGSRMLPWDGYP